MKHRLPQMAVAALLAAAVPTLALAQALPQQTPTKNEHRARAPRLSPESLTRLQDGRMAMIKETLKLNDAQLKLWGPVEAQMRAAATARQQARAERAQMQQQGAQRQQHSPGRDRATDPAAARSAGQRQSAHGQASRTDEGVRGRLQAILCRAER